MWEHVTKVIFWVEITYLDYTVVTLGKFHEFEDILAVFGLYFRSYNIASLSQVTITLRIFSKQREYFQ